MTNLTQLRIASAKAVGHQPRWPEVGTNKGHLTVTRKGVAVRWAPDLEGHEAQLVELIEWLRERDLQQLLRAISTVAIPWKLAIMRAVAEVGYEAQRHDDVA